MNKLYRLGLDIGIGSIGWAVIENDPLTEEPCHILKLGVRVFSPNEVPKTGASTAAARREKRGVRRRKRRRSFRMLRMKNLFKNIFGNNIEEEIDKLKNEDVYQLRARSLDDKISNPELCKVILNILKRRGFKSNRKSGAGEDGKLLNAVKVNQQFLKDNGYRTIGEAIFKDERFRFNNAGKNSYLIRNHFGDYKNCFYRRSLSL